MGWGAGNMIRWHYQFIVMGIQITWNCKLPSQIRWKFLLHMVSNSCEKVGNFSSPSNSSETYNSLLAWVCEWVI